MRAVGIIPARWASSRLPGKAAVELAGRSLIEHVWRGARRSRRLRDVFVATDDERIAALCRSFGATAVMTSPAHPTGTDRIAEVAAALDDEIVVNVQGDEPLIEPRVIDAALDALAADPEAPMATVVHAADPAALGDPNRVKVVLDRRGRALYFSRAAIPALRHDAGAADAREATKGVWQHVGLYAYRRDFLLRFVRLERGVLESAERLEQLRALEHGHPIATGVVEGWRSVAVDVSGDVPVAEEALRRRAAQAAARRSR